MPTRGGRSGMMSREGPQGMMPRGDHYGRGPAPRNFNSYNNERSMRDRTDNEGSSRDGRDMHSRQMPDRDSFEKPYHYGGGLPQGRSRMEGQRPFRGMQMSQRESDLREPGAMSSRPPFTNRPDGMRGPPMRPPYGGGSTAMVPPSMTIMTSSRSPMASRGGPHLLGRGPSGYNRDSQQTSRPGALRC